MKLNIKYCRLRTLAQVVFNGKIMQLLYKYSEKREIENGAKKSTQKIRKIE